MYITLLFQITFQTWVRGSFNVLWLPSDYRPTKVAVYGNIFGFSFGDSSGRVVYGFRFLKLVLTSSPPTSVTDDSPFILLSKLGVSRFIINVGLEM